ncbi:MAG: citrate/2-methylcitrate synthase [Eggerthellaceae bacterium]|nr:citrate/2-methylcitrate synthase [Eggerthellaceae bacterium]
MASELPTSITNPQSPEAGRPAAYDPTLDADTRAFGVSVGDEEPIAIDEDEARKVKLFENFHAVNAIDAAEYDRYDVKRGLRNADGTGVIVGMTNISNVHGYTVSDDGRKIADDGSLRFRGYELYDLLGDLSPDRRFAFEEVAYLLLMGELPTQSQLERFVEVIDSQRELPDGFTASMLMRHTPPDIMNVLARSVLQLYAYDDYAEDRSPEHEIHTALSLMSRLPRIMVLTYYSKRARYHHESMIMHRFVPGQSTAETILSMLRPDRQFTQEEARMLDIMLCLHAEHGGGNNSTFTTRVLTSSDTDPYSTYAGAIGSLKGHRHGGANHQVLGMQSEIKQAVAHWDDDDEVADYLARIVNKQAYDKTGLVYGMGHAVYTLSDPRAVICKRFAETLARGTEFEAEFNLLQSIERLAPEVILREKGTKKDMCANVDMYSGFVYSMMGIPRDLFTPLFACARMAGWAAHRFEEIGSGKRIIRPAYKNTIAERRTYAPIAER